MHIEDDGAPRGAVEDVRLEDDTVMRGVVHEDKAVPPPSEPARAVSCGISSPEAQLPVDAPELSSTSRALQEFERSEAMAFYRRVEGVTNLTDRAFMLRLTGYRPFDERSRNLVVSVAGEGPVGAFVQHLLQSPQARPESILKAPHLPRCKKSVSLKPPKSLIELLLGDDDKAA